MISNPSIKPLLWALPYKGYTPSTGERDINKREYKCLKQAFNRLWRFYDGDINTDVLHHEKSSSKLGFAGDAVTTTADQSDALLERQRMSFTGKTYIISIIDLQAIALSLQLQIRAQRKQDKSLYNADTITEHEWKARRHHNTVLSNTVQQMLSLAELKAIVLDTPHSTQLNNAERNYEAQYNLCGCVRCAAGDLV